MHYAQDQQSAESLYENTNNNETMIELSYGVAAGGGVTSRSEVKDTIHGFNMPIQS